MNKFLEELDFEDLMEHLQCGAHVNLTTKSMLEAIDSYMTAKEIFKYPTFIYNIDQGQYKILEEILKYLVDCDAVSVITPSNRSIGPLYTVVKLNTTITEALKNYEVNPHCAGQFQQIINAMAKQGLKRDSGLGFILRIIKVYRRYHEKS